MNEPATIRAFQEPTFVDEIFAECKADGSVAAIAKALCTFVVFAFLFAIGFTVSRPFLVAMCAADAVADLFCGSEQQWR